LKPDDPFVKITEDLFQLDLIPAIRSLLEHWHGDLAREIELDPLEASHHSPLPPAAPALPPPTPATPAAPAGSEPPPPNPGA
jgi:hypothetical protein